MVDPNVTPEERLLRLIESGERGELKPKTVQRSIFWNVRTWSKNLFARRNKTNGSSGVRSAAGLSPELNLRLMNRALIVFLILVVGGIAFNMNRVKPSLKALFSQVVASRPLAGEEQALASLRPLADYVGEVEKRDLFHPVPPPKPKGPEPKAALVKPPGPTPLEILREKATALKLVGISWGETPIAMIEDTTKRETSFFKAGQFINEIQVKAILKDRAVLSYGDAEYDLF